MDFGPLRWPKVTACSSKSSSVFAGAPGMNHTSEPQTHLQPRPVMTDSLGRHNSSRAGQMRILAIPMLILFVFPLPQHSEAFKDSNLMWKYYSVLGLSPHVPVKTQPLKSPHQKLHFPVP